MQFRILPPVFVVCSFLLPAQTILPLAEARRLVGLGEIGAAEENVRSYLSSNKDSGDAHFLLGYILFKKRDAKASLAAYTEGARYRKPGAYDLEVVGCDYVLLKAYADADKWLSKSVEWEPNNLSALYYLGRTKYNENRFEEAVDLFQRCLKLDPKNVKYEDNLGLSYQGLGRNEEAEGAYRSAIDWDSAVGNPGPYLNLGSLLLDTDRAAAAIPLLEKAVQIAPRDVRVHTQLSKAYLHNNQLEKAETELEAAVQLEPRSASAHFMLAQVYRKRGFPEKARQESATYSELNAEGKQDPSTAIAPE